MPKTMPGRLKTLVFTLIMLAMILSIASCFSIKVKPKGEDGNSAAATTAATAAPAINYVKGTVTITKTAQECGPGMHKLYDSSGKDMGLVPIDIQTGYIKYQFSVPLGNYVLKYDCLCSYKGKPDSYPGKEIPVNVNADGVSIKVNCPP